MRYDRVQNCHYFDENNDSQSIDNAKRQILKEMIDNMTLPVKKKFDKKYPNILNEIYPHITKINPTI